MINVKVDSSQALRLMRNRVDILDSAVQEIPQELGEIGFIHARSIVPEDSGQTKSFITKLTFSDEVWIVSYPPIDYNNEGKPIRLNVLLERAEIDANALKQLQWGNRKQPKKGKQFGFMGKSLIEIKNQLPNKLGEFAKKFVKG